MGAGEGQPRIRCSLGLQKLLIQFPDCRLKVRSLGF